MLVRERRDEDATDMIAGLSSLFRYVLDHAGRQEVSLKQELAFLGEYLAIEKVRFKDQLEVVLNVEPETLTAYVPTLLLQPLDSGDCLLILEDGTELTSSRTIRRPPPRSPRPALGVSIGELLANGRKLSPPSSRKKRTVACRPPRALVHRSYQRSAL